MDDYKKNGTEIVTPESVRALLEENKYITKAEMGEILNACEETISKQLRILRENGDSIIFSNEGLSLLTKEIIEDPERAHELEQHQNWILGVMKAMIVGAKTIKPLLPTMRRTLKLNTSVEERRRIKQSCARTIYLITMAEAEEEMA